MQTKYVILLCVIPTIQIQEEIRKIQGDQKVSVHLTITVQRTHKNTEF